MNSEIMTGEYLIPHFLVIDKIYSQLSNVIWPKRIARLERVKSYSLLFYLTVFCFEHPREKTPAHLNESTTAFISLVYKFICLHLLEEVDGADYHLSKSHNGHQEVEEGEVVEETELISVNQEEIDRIAAEGIFLCS